MYYRSPLVQAPGLEEPDLDGQVGVAGRVLLDHVLHVVRPQRVLEPPPRRQHHQLMSIFVKIHSVKWIT